MIYEFVIPIRTMTEANTGGHWAVKAKRAKDQRGLGRLMFQSLHLKGLPKVVTLTRLAPRFLDGHDNLRSSIKHVVDGIADALGIDDGSNKVEWRYAQRKAKEYGVLVEVIG